VLYAILSEDFPNSQQHRGQVRPRHMEYLRPLVEQGRVVLAGPHPAIDSPDPGPAGMSGSLIVAEFDSLEDARAWAAKDPYAVEGVFETSIIKPFLQVVYP
jgi:uncharacterized protein